MVELSQENQHYCQQIAKNDDWDRYCVSLYAPATLQRHIWSVLAFNQEVAKIRETVSDPLLGEIRLTWWMDVLDEIEQGDVRKQPVVEELATMLKARPALSSYLRDMLEARRLDILGEGTASFEALKEYASSVGGSFQKALAALSLDKTPSQECLQAAEKIGTAWTMLGLVRAIPYQWQSGNTLLPKETDPAMAMQKAADAWALFKPTVDQMILFSEAMINDIASLKKQLKKEEKQVLLSYTLLKLINAQLKKAQGNPFDLPLYPVSDAKKMWVLLWAKLTGRY